MKKVYCIGEALIDFIPNEKGCSLENVVTFNKMAGGAPANVAAGVAKLGGKSTFISKLGQDGFGRFITESLKRQGVDTSLIKYTTKAHTGLAFVSLDETGDRDFIFYRDPSADMLLEENEIQEEWFEEGDVLHFCSVDLIEAPVKYAHKKAIEIVKRKGGIISFDPNVRLPLFESEEACRNAIMPFISYADILKLSEEEVSFLFDVEDEALCYQKVKEYGVQMLIITKGDKGATIYFKDFKVDSDVPKVEVVDTTGAGDAFISAFLCLMQKKGGFKAILKQEILREILRYACVVGSMTTMKKGAIEAIPLHDEVLKYL